MDSPTKQTTRSKTTPGETPGPESELETPKHPELRFKVTSVERMEIPSGADGGIWYRYVIKNEATTVTGSRRGSKAAVTEHAAQYAEQLNAKIEPRRKPRYPGRPKHRAPASGS